jgi:hypothetical protein
MQHTTQSIFTPMVHVAEVAPGAVPVTVTVYWPAVVPGSPVVVVPAPALFPLPPPPQDSIPPLRDIRSSKLPRTARQRRNRLGVLKSRRQAREAAPAVYQEIRFPGLREALLLAAVVRTVSVALTLVIPVTLTGLVVPKLKVGRCWAPGGAEVTAALSVMAPVNPPVGVIPTEEVFPVVAPGGNCMGTPPDISKLGIGTGVTETSVVAEALL